MRVTKITATIVFDEPVDQEEAIQTLLESVGDDTCDFTFVYENGTRA